MVRCVTQNNKLQTVNLSTYMQCEMFGGMRGIIISVYLKKVFFIRNYIHIIQKSVSKTYKKSTCEGIHGQRGPGIIHKLIVFNEFLF